MPAICCYLKSFLLLNYENVISSIITLASVSWLDVVHVCPLPDSVRRVEAVERVEEEGYGELHTRANSCDGGWEAIK